MTAGGPGTVMPFTESMVEQAALAWLESVGCRIAHGPEVSPDDVPVAERRDYGELVSGRVAAQVAVSGECREV